jgi:exosortase A-associated hydrolase 1
MTRRHFTFEVNGDICVATLDSPNETADAKTGLLIVSGGNEIRSGAHSGQANMAAHFAAYGHPVMRYDRRGIGESSGENLGFEHSADDICAAVAAFRKQMPNLSRIVAFGNCDAAAALALLPKGARIDALVISNPWVIEPSNNPKEQAALALPAAAIRARYWARIQNPRSLIDLFMGKISLYKLALGLRKLVVKETENVLAMRLSAALCDTNVPVKILIANYDTTALSFMAEWKGKIFAKARTRTNISIDSINSASHSFADAKSNAWLIAKIKAAIGAADAIP